MMLTITVSHTKLVRLLERVESIIDYFDEIDDIIWADVEHVRKAIAFAKINPGTVLDKALMHRKKERGLKRFRGYNL